ncbi:efflux RND transporter permease subunit, partial [bacterium]|nr:efflux RND transporter permease subunit [bacterium]
PRSSGPVNVGGGAAGGHLAYVSVYLVPIDERKITAEKFVAGWDKSLKHISGIESLSFLYTIGASGSQPINLMLSHNDTQILETAVSDLAEALRGYAGVRDVDDGFSIGKTQLDFRIKPEAQTMGLTTVELARQVRAAFYGSEALRIQRGRDEVKVMVRYPEADRRTLFSIESMLIRTPAGAEIPLKQAADIIEGISYTQILRSDGRRVLKVTADVEQGVANADKVIASVMENELPDLLKRYPGLRLELEGEQKDKAEAMSSLGFGFIFAMFGIYALLAIPFKSYSQPMIIMTSIPFGIIGAVLGHIIMGFELSVISMMGMVALAGVVVNDSLVLINTTNHQFWNGMSHLEAITSAAIRRFRPIVLTSLTTFLGLAPMIFETALQARLLVPMAISLGFGILFATVIALILIPCLYMVLADVTALWVPEVKS